MIGYSQAYVLLEMNPQDMNRFITFWFKQNKAET